MNNPSVNQYTDFRNIPLKNIELVASLCGIHQSKASSNMEEWHSLFKIFIEYLEE